MASDYIPLPDRRFDPYRSASTPRAMQLVNSVVERLEAYEREHRLRRRARKPRDQKVFEETVEALVCDLAHRFLSDVEGRIAVSLSNQHLGRHSRYRAPALGKALPDILAVMATPELSFLTMKKGTKALIIQSDDGVREVIQKGQVTTLQPGGALRSLIGDHGLGLEDFGRADSEEIIILKAAKTGPKDPGERLEYIDNDQTNRFRLELKDINRWIAFADLDLIQFEEEAAIDTHQRRLYRVFNDGSLSIGAQY